MAKSFSLYHFFWIWKLQFWAEKAWLSFGLGKRVPVVEHEGKYGTTYTFHLQLEFTPTMTTVSAGTLQLEAEISKKLYESLWESKSVNITYAVVALRIFILEGE